MHAGWITAGHSELWNCNSTYCTVPIDLIPPLNEIEIGLTWLDDVPNYLKKIIRQTSSLDSEDNRIGHLDVVLKQAAQIGTKIPQSFVEFLSDSRLQAKVPSCTACYLELSDEIVPIPNHAGQYALRFMNDSQSCVMWYLLLRENLEPQVFASRAFFEREIFDAMNDEENPLAYEDVAECALVCAESFPEFLYRFWIENTIWYSLSENADFSKRQRAYVNQIDERL